MANEIEVSLFDTLEEVSKLLEADGNEEEDEEFILRIHSIEANLETFIENFFLQFFNNGFELEIGGITESDFSQIENHFSSSKISPKNMIACFQEAIEILGDIETAIYLDPPRDEDLCEAFMTFLPKLFESFRKDELVISDRIENCGKIKIRMEGILVKIKNLKKQRTLS